MSTNDNGPRPRAGRPRLHSERMTNRTITMTPSHSDRLDEIAVAAGKSASAIVRKWIDANKTKRKVEK